MVYIGNLGSLGGGYSAFATYFFRGKGDGSLVPIKTISISYQND